VKFIHAADIHLDSPFAGLTDAAEAPVERLRGCTRRALTNLVDYALENAIDFVVIAGDLYDGDWRDYATGLFFVKEMGRLARAQIPVYLLYGNHDAESQISKRLVLPENVHRFPAKAPHTHIIRDLKVALHGQSFATAAVTDNLARAYPPARPGHFNIGLLHTAATGHEGHAPYAPCQPAELIAKGYDYWALGHVHAREVLQEFPHIVFAGNLQGRNIRETGAKGFTVVTVAEHKVAGVEAVAADVVRWARLTLAAGSCADLEALWAQARAELAQAVREADGRLLVVRLVLTGRTALNGWLKDHPETLAAELRAVAGAVSADLWIEQVVVATETVHDLEAAAARPDAVGTLLQAAGALLTDPAATATLEAELAEVIARLPDDVRFDAYPGGRLAADDLAALIGEAKVVIASRLLDDFGEA
jgi:DNA repair exonuclease SbcCD nuclease subunit